MLIDGLIPLNFFLRTDIVELVPGSDTLAQYVSSVSVESKDAKLGRTVSTEWPETDSNSASDQERWSVTIAGRNIEPMPFCPHLASDYSFRENRPVEDLLKVFPPFPRAQEEHEAQSDDIPLDVLAAAGKCCPADVFPRDGNSDLSNIVSAERVTAVCVNVQSAGGDIEMEGGGDAEAAESAGEEEDDSEDDEDETPPSGYFELQRTRCTAYPFRAANASVAALGAGA
ncbi:unnamed protein product [Symbiodinium microadriaticum]|nr:unnamed protein product [Symbiodinium microadriaticum]